MGPVPLPKAPGQGKNPAPLAKRPMWFAGAVRFCARGARRDSATSTNNVALFVVSVIPTIVGTMLVGRCWRDALAGLRRNRDPRHAIAVRCDDSRTSPSRFSKCAGDAFCTGTTSPDRPPPDAGGNCSAITWRTCFRTVPKMPGHLDAIAGATITGRSVGGARHVLRVRRAPGLPFLRFAPVRQQRKPVRERLQAALCLGRAGRCSHLAIALRLAS